jgi:hypothetical protein
MPTESDITTAHRTALLAALAVSLRSIGTGDRLIADEAEGNGAQRNATMNDTTTVNMVPTTNPTANRGSAMKSTSASPNPSSADRAGLSW